MVVAKTLPETSEHRGSRAMVYLQRLLPETSEHRGSRAMVVAKVSAGDVRA